MDGWMDRWIYVWMEVIIEGWGGRDDNTGER